VPAIITTDHPLSDHGWTASQRALLAALLDTLVPASDDGEMPSAADVGFDAYLLAQAESFIPTLESALENFAPSFAACSLAERCEHVGAFAADSPELFRSLLTRVYDCYYQHDRVRARIGVVTGAPFPQGNVVVQGDLSLLDPVIANSARHRYRRS
jgi:hypothetical protein